MKEKSKQYAVIGLGRFGASVARTLHKLGYEVLAVDSDEEMTQKFSDEVTYVVQADTTDENSLKAMGIRNYDVVVVAIGDDIQANVVTTLLLKEMGVPYIVAKARNELHGKMLEKIGADRVIYPERDMGQRVAHNIISNNVLDYIELAPNLSLAEVKTPSCYVGKTLAQADLRSRYGVNVVAMKRGERIIVPPLPSEVMQAEDILIIVGGIEGVQSLEEQA